MKQEQVQKQKQQPARRSHVQDEPPVNQQDDELAEAVDDLLDEIDSVLEENAEEFVRSYVQLGGQ